MIRITEILQNEKNKDFVTVVTEENSFTLHNEICIGERLYAGKMLNARDIQRLQSLNDNKLALAKSLSYIARKKCSVKMMYDYLKNKGFSESACNYAVQRLKEYRYIDDESFAASYINYSVGKGKLKIAYELRNKGISDEIIQKHFYGDTEEAENCLMAAKKLIKDKDINDLKTRQKIIRHLVYRGFEYEIVQQTVNKLKDDDFEI